MSHIREAILSNTMTLVSSIFGDRKRTDKSLLARFFFADEELNAVAAELDSFDGRKDPDRCTALVNKLRACQDTVLVAVHHIMDEVIPNQRAPRDYRVKYPDDVIQENLLGQLWFGAECLAAGSSIMHREVESASMRPLARALTRTLENLRNSLRDQCLKNGTSYHIKIRESMIMFDELLAEFELSYVSAMVPVKSAKEFETMQDIVVLFSETVERAVRRGLLSRDMIDSCDPALMFTIPRLAIVSGLVYYKDGPLNPETKTECMSEMFRPFQTLLCKIKQLLLTLSRQELSSLERALCTCDDASDGAPTSAMSDTHDLLPARTAGALCDNPGEDVAATASDDPSSGSSTNSNTGSNSDNPLSSQPELVATSSQHHVTTNAGTIAGDHQTNLVTVHSEVASDTPVPGANKSKNDFSDRGVTIQDCEDVTNQTEIYEDACEDLSPIVSLYHVGPACCGSDDSCNSCPIPVETTSESETSRPETSLEREISTTGHSKDSKDLAGVHPSGVTDNKSTATATDCTSPSGSSVILVSQYDSITTTCDDMTTTCADITTTCADMITMYTDKTTTCAGNEQLPIATNHFNEPIAPLESSRELAGRNSRPLYKVKHQVADQILKTSNEDSQLDYVPRQRYNSTCSSDSDCDSVCDSDTSSYSSDCNDDEEVLLAIQAAELANHKGVRSRFKNSEELKHKLFVCVSGVADQLQTNFASDLRNILRTVFAMHSSDRAELADAPTPGKPATSTAATFQLSAAQIGRARTPGPPRWVPDAEVAACTRCGLVFTLVRRRHHCRNCGQIFCHSCSSGTTLLPYFGHRVPVRVCNFCSGLHARAPADLTS